MLVVGFVSAATRGPILIATGLALGSIGRARALGPRALRRLPLPHAMLAGVPAVAVLAVLFYLARRCCRRLVRVAVAAAVVRARRVVADRRVFQQPLRAASPSGVRGLAASARSTAPRSGATGARAPAPVDPAAESRASSSRRAASSPRARRRAPRRWRWVSLPSWRFSLTASGTRNFGPACGPSAAGCAAARRRSSSRPPRGSADDLGRALTSPALIEPLQRGAGEPNPVGMRERLHVLRPRRAQPSRQLPSLTPPPVSLSSVGLSGSAAPSGRWARVRIEDGDSLL